MLYLRLQVYEALSSNQWVLTVRDLDAGVDQDHLLMHSMGAWPGEPSVDRLDSLVLVAQQALERAVRDHMLRQAESFSDEE